ncbi:MAG: Fur family ferric uptake transcriptional regulator [Arcticibacterium sp.]|jgi:Fur family ferric uptake transcriptional regulator
MIDKKNIQEYLVAHDVRKTPFRIELLGLFMENKNSLSHQEIKERTTSTRDKVTIYRALDTFLKKGLIHKVPDANNVSKYALCPPECSKGSHEHNHIHFICNRCNNTFCIDKIKVPVIKDIIGFKVKSSKLTLEGECPDCLSYLNQ